MSDDLQPCPHCAEPIPRIAGKCKHCGEFLKGSVKLVDPGVGMLMSFGLGVVLVATACVVTGLAASIVGPNMVRVKRQTNEREAVKSLKAIIDAQVAFQEQDLDGDGRKNFGTLAQLASAGKLDPDLASGLQHQFVFEVGVSGPFPEERWMATARPITRGRRQTRFFATNHSGAIYFRQRPFPLDLNRCEFPPDSFPLGSLKDLR